MQFFAEHGAFGLFLLSLCEASFFPLAPDFLLIPLALQWPDRAFSLAGLATLGSFLGGLKGYALGYFGGRPLLRRFASAPKVERVEGVFDRYGVWGVGVAGFTPLPYKLFTLASGACRLRIVPFAVAAGVSRGLRFFLVAFLVQQFGERVRENFAPAGLVALAGCTLGLSIWWLVTRRRGAPPAISRTGPCPIDKSDSAPETGPAT